LKCGNNELGRDDRCWGCFGQVTAAPNAGNFLAAIWVGVQLLQTGHDAT
jgi:hypothetical protein